MNDPIKQSLAQLEQATSSEATEPLDEETAMLRDSWLTLGRLLAAADEESEQPIVRAPQPRHAGVPVRWMAGLAASLLVMFAAWAMLKSRSDGIDPPHALNAPNLPSVLDPIAAEVSHAHNAGGSGDVVDEYAWEDSFDEQLAAASRAIRSVQSDWSNGDHRYSALLNQFERFTEELSEGSL